MAAEGTGGGRPPNPTAHGASGGARTRDEALAIVAHDLRNRLSAVLVGFEIALDRSFPEERRKEALQAVQSASIAMHRLIQGLVDIAGCETGTVEIVRSTIEVEALVSTACRLAASGAGRPRIHHHVSCEAVSLRADPRRLLQVLLILLDCAVKHTPEDGEVSVRVERAGEAVRFLVRGSGGGIPAEAQPHLFDWDWQVRRARRGGAGLELAIARGLVEAHGGRIGAASAPGRRGTLFFDIPAAPVLVPG